MKLLKYFEELRASGGKGFVTYLLAGYPEKKWTVPLMIAAAEAGATAIELGVPFSDPIADGPILQKANFKSLQSGVSLDHAIAMAGEASKRISIPILLMGYANPFLQKGWERLAKEAASNGVGGFIVADLPAEESAGVAKTFQSRDLGLTLLCSPTTQKERMKIIDRNSTSFVYLVAAKGVTGPREKLPGYLPPLLKQVKRIVAKPVYVGFGLSHPDQAAAVAKHADGVILGSRIAAFLEDRAENRDLDASLRDFLLPWAGAVNPVHAAG